MLDVLSLPGDADTSLTRPPLPHRLSAAASPPSPPVESTFMNPICFRARPISLYRVVKPLFNNRSGATIVRRPPPSTYFSRSAPKAMAKEYKLKGVTSLDLRPGSKQEVEVEGLDTKVLLLNDGTKVQAVGAKCTHYGAPLVNGVLTTNGRLTCPWHGG